MPDEVDREGVGYKKAKRVAQETRQLDAHVLQHGSRGSEGAYASLLPGLLGSDLLNGPGNESVRASVMQRAQQTYGNRAVQRFLQRTASSLSSDDLAEEEPEHEREAQLHRPVVSSVAHAPRLVIQRAGDDDDNDNDADDEDALDDALEDMKGEREEELASLGTGAAPTDEYLGASGSGRDQRLMHEDPRMQARYDLERKSDEGGFFRRQVNKVKETVAKAKTNIKNKRLPGDTKIPGSDYATLNETKGDKAKRFGKKAGVMAVKQATNMIPVVGAAKKGFSAYKEHGRQKADEAIAGPCEERSYGPSEAP